MAMLSIIDYIDINCKGYHNATSWQVALDPDFTQIIDESIEDKVNVQTWHTMLPKIDGNGYYADLDNLYARAKVHIDNSVSDWFVMEPKNQNKQKIIVTELDGTLTEYDSIEDNFN